VSLPEDARAWLLRLPLLAAFLILGLVGGGLYLRSAQPAIGAGVVMLACLFGGVWLTMEIVGWERSDTSPPHQHPDSDPDPESEA
jgi:hypothetical protein